jgi:hypothetical protein
MPFLPIDWEFLASRKNLLFRFWVITVKGRPEDFCLKGMVGRSWKGDPILHNSVFYCLRKEIWYLLPSVTSSAMFTQSLTVSYSCSRRVQCFRCLRYDRIYSVLRIYSVRPFGRLRSVSTSYFSVRRHGGEMWSVRRLAGRVLLLTSHFWILLSHLTVTS